MASSSNLNRLYGRHRPAAQHRQYRAVWPNYTLPAVVKYAVQGQGNPPAFIPGTNMPNMPLGFLPGMPAITPQQMEQMWGAMDQMMDSMPPELQSKIAQRYVEASWPHLGPRVQQVANEAADTASVRAVFMAGGVALVVVLASYWIKKG
jgi:hypothetical protein